MTDIPALIARVRDLQDDDCDSDFLLRAAPALATALEAAMAENARLDASLSEELAARDWNAECADKLADAIAPVEVIGEHTNLNDPWLNAINEAEGLHAKCAALEAENERLRGALREIAGYDLRIYGDSVAHEMRDEARAALEGTK